MCREYPRSFVFFSFPPRRLNEQLNYSRLENWGKYLYSDKWGLLCTKWCSRHSRAGSLAPRWIYLSGRHLKGNRGTDRFPVALIPNNTPVRPGLSPRVAERGGGAKQTIRRLPGEFSAAEV